ncbi:sugar phosphate isomerase/epimerase family protein [Novosphingobium album (ex Liu et al. 2023)]|uniref:Sugar phosphate isomerase/epimerase n=1 Tax=Novosphingobium album (ex Liu et al. 2023) TaxID=3031130 RepID=A0ABT5WM27_9SPHN|nr:sugar phosphate isomerase/epimerase family protein [Novosphingobium album (ex Liu et al. 2023)]MDE8651099.1 sugar phosphate isomerase/epimerase [Novosphingobium album (ex Liu et al. 2023)]
MHARVCLHQVGFVAEGTTAFVEFCRSTGIGHMTMVNPHLLGEGVLAEAQAALAAGGPRATTLNQPFARFPDIERDEGEAALRLNEAIEAAATLGAPQLYIVTGGRGGLDWEAAATRLAELIAPCRDLAAARGVRLLVENANCFNADIHIAHTIDDTIRLAELAGIGVCIDLGAGWFEGGLREKFARAMPLTGLVQVSDYVLGDRSTPCRAVPGDGCVPLERQIGWLLDAGYEGVFDLELVGPRIEAEGVRAASSRAAETLSNMLTRLGA